MNRDDPLLRRCVSAIEAAYGVRASGVILYGSCARDDETSESDVDLLVLLNEDFDLWTEICRLVDVVYPFELECGRHISAKPISAHEFRESANLLYESARSEGVAL